MFATDAHRGSPTAHCVLNKYFSFSRLARAVVRPAILPWEVRTSHRCRGMKAAGPRNKSALALIQPVEADAGDGQKIKHHHHRLSGGFRYALPRFVLLFRDSQPPWRCPGRASRAYRRRCAKKTRRGCRLPAAVSRDTNQSDAEVAWRQSPGAGAGGWVPREKPRLWLAAARARGGWLQ
jgi:hypothetical protein